MKVTTYVHECAECEIGQIITTLQLSDNGVKCSTDYCTNPFCKKLYMPEEFPKLKLVSKSTLIK